MRSHLKLGRLFGVPVGVNLSVVVVAAVLLVSLARFSLPSLAPRHPGSAYWFAALLGVVAFLGSLVAHEMGHSYVAMSNGVRVREVTLWMFGGVAKLEGDADNPGVEFRIAAAGPAMSALTAVVAALAAWGVDRFDGSRVLFVLLVWLAAMNVVLAVSNLIPAFPLDGGRILRAVLWRRSGRRISATRTAALWGQILAGVIAAAAVWLAVQVSLYSGVWILALGLFLFMAARAEWSGAAADPQVLDRTVAQVRRRLPAPLTATATVADVERCLAFDPSAPLVPLTDQRGTVSAMVPRGGVARIPPAQRPLVPATSIAEPLVSLPRVAAGESVRGVVARLGQGSAWWALVVDPDGSMGALLSSDVDELLEVARG